jgi:predicted nucleotidyltransferase
MVLGFDTPRPSAKDYEKFLEKLVEDLKSESISGLSLMIYGSYVRGDYQPGRSDIDAVMVFDNDVVTNKEDIMRASSILAKALNGRNVPFQVNLVDRATMRDGRFNSYDETFKPYFAEEGRILVGPDYREEFVYELPTFPEQVPIRFNLRKARNGLLFSQHDRDTSHTEFLRKFTKSLDAVSRASKQVLVFKDGVVRKNRFSAINELREKYPQINLEALEKIRRLYANLDEMDDLFAKPEEAVILWQDATTLMEELLREYLRENPRA